MRLAVTAETRIRAAEADVAGLRKQLSADGAAADIQKR